MCTAVAPESGHSTTTWGDPTDTPRDHAAEQPLALIDQYERPLYGFLVKSHPPYLSNPHRAY